MSRSGTSKSSGATSATSPSPVKVQKKLFSFFTPKPKTTASASVSAKKLAQTLPTGLREGASNGAKIFNTKKRPPSLQASISAISSAKKVKTASADSVSPETPPPVGSRVEIHWPDDDQFYAGVVSKQNGYRVRIDYDDGEFEVLNIKNENWRYEEKIQVENEDEVTKEGTDEEDEEEEAEKNEESDGSIFEPDHRNDAEEEEDIEFDDDLDEDDEDLPPLPRKILQSQSPLPKENHAQKPFPKRDEKMTSVQKYKLTYVDSSPVPSKKEIADVPSTNSSVVTPRPPRSTLSSKIPAVAGVVTPPPRSLGRPAPLLPEAGVVNSQGSHWHNHYTFLTEPKDFAGKSPEDADYDHRTLRVNFGQMEKVSGKVSPAQAQWWDIKSRYFDTVLLFKTGKFYEMFHMDADIGVSACNFVYMKGQNAHSGFPEPAYGIMTAKLIKAGYKVARVEQTETPTQLKERKKNTKGKKPQVVNREVCSVQSVGTRTFCFLDDARCFQDEGGNTSAERSNGPLLAIHEMLLPPAETNIGNDHVEESDDDPAPAPVCEYGVTVVDAVRSIVTLGEFADDVLRSRMHTLLCYFQPSEILIEGGGGGASKDLRLLIESICPKAIVEIVNTSERCPKSTALSLTDRQVTERPSPAHPWNADETVSEIKRKKYFGRGSREGDGGTSRWPEVLRSCVDGGAKGALSAFGASLFYLQRGLVDEEIISMSIVKAYVPPESAATSETTMAISNGEIESKRKGKLVLAEMSQAESTIETGVDQDMTDGISPDSEPDHMQIDGITLENLEFFSNKSDTTEKGTLWYKLNRTKSPQGCRMLRAWLLRPLFRKVDIDRRSDAVSELASGAAALAMNEARPLLSQCGDIERLLSRIHSMSLSTDNHPGGRAVLYELDIYNRRKVEAFSKLLNGLEAASKIAEIFENIDISSGLLKKIVRRSTPEGDGGCFPQMETELNWFVDNFDCKMASKGNFEPPRGVNNEYDQACDTIEHIEQKFKDYRDEMCKMLRTSEWIYANTKHEQRDKYTICLPVSVSVPDDFVVTGKRGSGAKQVTKYYTETVAVLVDELEHAIAQKKEAKEMGLRSIFAKFDSHRPIWAAAAQATAMLDALAALAEVSSMPGFCKPTIIDGMNCKPKFDVKQGCHFCVESTYDGGDFIPNDLCLGGDGAKLLLLSGPNMGGKSTLLRQTCLIAILAQLGCHVPAESCSLTPFDRIFTRLGSSDRILQGQSTFFVELSETAAALRGATSRSLVIMDELGRGTSTFDGTAIAHAVVRHLVERTQCVTMFATHYHSLLDDWRSNKDVRLGHMECICSDDSGEAISNEKGNKNMNDHDITFLYTLGEGACPRSFGINVARLAGIPYDVLAIAKNRSMAFEAEFGKM